MFPQRLASIPTHLATFWKFVSKITKKNGENWKFIKKWLNMSKISKFCNFWAISTCNTSKERIFHIEFTFKQKKYDFFFKIHKKIGKNWKSIKKWPNMSKISKFCNFRAISTCNTSKESIFHIEFKFKQKKSMISFKKNWKKSNFSFLCVKINADLLSKIAKFSYLCKEIWKLSWSVLWKGSEIKSHQERAHYLKPLGNGEQISPVVASRATPQSD